MEATSRSSDASVWVLPDDSAPLRHVRESYARRHGPVEPWFWLTAAPGSTTYGRTLSLPVRGSGYPMSVKVVSPSMLAALVRHPAPVVVVLELDLSALYAVLSRLRHRGRAVVALIEGDVAELGPTGSARWKMWFRRRIARHVDVFVANSEHARRYLVDALGVPAERIEQGWWLAGLPEGIAATPPPPALLAARRGPTFITVGQLIPRKGHVALIEAAARYCDRHGPCQVWILGEGPERAALESRAAALGLADAVTFFGHVEEEVLRGALEAADVFVFPTRNDLVGRALVEALSTGIPTIVSRRSGAMDALLEDGRNCIAVDADDDADLDRALALTADPVRLGQLREAAGELVDIVGVDAAADVIARSVDRARAS